KEKVSISASIGIFHKKLTFLKKFPKEQEEFAFEIAFDKLYQFIAPITYPPKNYLLALLVRISRLE
ncbi:MAG: hypothetical protein IKA28_07735, partial [Tidjanibacter sp.]|nr:hypothetical protein [Tidjanibacter sp.]